MSDMTTTPLTSRADVTIDRPQRWAKQLVSHLSRKAPVEATDDGDVLTIGSGTGTVRAEAERVVLLAQAPDAESLGRVEHVLGSHLERFAEKEGIAVAWQR